MSPTLVKIALIVICFSNVGVFGQIGKNVTFFSHANCTGFYSTIERPQWPIPDLAKFLFENMAQSVKFQGRWLFYDSKNYNENKDSLVLYLYSPNFACQNLGITPSVNSARYLGVNNAAGQFVDSITLFSMSRYQGQQEVYHSPATSLSLAKHTSIVVFGNQPLTLYKQTGHTGPSICIQPELNGGEEPAFVPNLSQLTPSIPSDFIKSLKFGCDPTATPIILKRSLNSRS